MNTNNNNAKGTYGGGYFRRGDKYGGSKSLCRGVNVWVCVCVCMCVWVCLCVYECVYVLEGVLILRGRECFCTIMAGELERNSSL